MNPRLNMFLLAPDATKAMVAVEEAIARSGLEISLVELVRLRSSQINRCAYCIYTHVSDAVKHGEDHMRLHLVGAWRESPLFSDRERAALAWTESLTNVAATHAPDSDYEALEAHFSESEIANLTMLIGAINLWNRIQIASRAQHPVSHRQAA